LVSGSTEVQVVARSLVEAVHTPRVGVARIVGAKVVIVAIHLAPLALSVDALVREGANAAIVATGVHRFVLAAGHGVAEIYCAGACVVAIHRLTCAFAILAKVVLRTGILVRTGAVVGQVNTRPGVNITIVDGARIIVVTDIDVVDAARISRQREGATHRRIALV
jgi:hypothetical protein